MRTASVVSVDKPDPVTLTVSQNNPTPAYGSYSRITGKFTPSSGTAGGKRVYLQYYSGRMVHHGGYHTTASDGTVPYFDVRPKDKTQYRLNFPQPAPTRRSDYRPSP